MAKHEDNKSVHSPTSGGIAVEVGGLAKSETRYFVPGNGRTEWFKDCDVGPEMVVVPAGEFMMGSPEREAGRFDVEAPFHKVTIAKPFAMGRFAITFEEWDVAHVAGGVNHKPDDEGWGRGRHPVVNVSWEDADDYCTWLSRITGKSYRLLSEAEWEYCCRAGTTTPFWWGTSISTDQANYDGNFTYGGDREGQFRDTTVPVESFQPNAFGLYNVHGNVWEWLEDRWHDNYNGAPSDGSAWTKGGNEGFRVLRGGSWNSDPRYLRSAGRFWFIADGRIIYTGFRISRTLD